MNIREWMRNSGLINRLPHSYLVLDTETTGLDPQTDLITEIGLVDVQDGCDVVCEGVVLDWTREPALDQRWLQQRLIETQRQIEDRGRTFRQTYDYLHEHPQRIAPRDALRQIYDWIADVLSNRGILMGHNFWGFDRLFFQNAFQRWLNVGFTLRPHEMLDTGIIEKACQLDMMPRPGEQFGDFCKRVSGTRSRVKWALSEHCVPKYGLVYRYNLDMDRAHLADFDAYVTHLLFEEFKAMATEETLVVCAAW